MPANCGKAAGSAGLAVGRPKGRKWCVDKQMVLKEALERIRALTMKPDQAAAVPEAVLARDWAQIQVIAAEALRKIKEI